MIPYITNNSARKYNLKFSKITLEQRLIFNILLTLNRHQPPETENLPSLYSTPGNHHSVSVDILYSGFPPKLYPELFQTVVGMNGK